MTLIVARAPSLIFLYPVVDNRTDGIYSKEVLNDRNNTMEHIPLHESVRWLKNSTDSVKVLKRFFNDRINLEETVEGLQKDFSFRWQREFQYLEKDPLFRSKNASNKSLADVLRLLAEEPKENAIVCCSVKSLLQRKQNSPTAHLQKWLSSCAADENSIEEYKITYMNAVDTMAEAERIVIKARRALREKETEDLVAYYKNALDNYTKEKTSFCQTMEELQEYLKESEKSRMDAVKESLQKYSDVISEYDEQRMTRKQKILRAKQELGQFSANKNVEDWLRDLQEPIVFPDYESNVQTPPTSVCQPTKRTVVREPVIPKVLYTIVEKPEEEAAAERMQEEETLMEAEGTSSEEEEESEEEETEEEERTEEETEEEISEEEETEGEEDRTEEETKLEEERAEEETEVEEKRAKKTEVKEKGAEGERTKVEEERAKEEETEVKREGAEEERAEIEEKRAEEEEEEESEEETEEEEGTEEEETEEEKRSEEEETEGEEDRTEKETELEEERAEEETEVEEKRAKENEVKEKGAEGERTKVEEERAKEEPEVKKEGAEEERTKVEQERAEEEETEGKEEGTDEEETEGEEERSEEEETEGEEEGTDEEETEGKEEGTEEEETEEPERAKEKETEVNERGAEGERTKVEEERAEEKENEVKEERVEEERTKVEEERAEKEETEGEEKGTDEEETEGEEEGTEEEETEEEAERAKREEETEEEAERAKEETELEEERAEEENEIEKERAKEEETEGKEEGGEEEIEVEEEEPEKEVEVEEEGSEEEKCSVVEEALEKVLTEEKAEVSQNSTENSKHSRQVDIGDAIMPATSSAIIVYAVQSHNAMVPGHLSFSFGQKIKQLRHADDQGLTYGYITIRKWPWAKKNKKYGFFQKEMVTARPPKVSLRCRFIC